MAVPKGGTWTKKTGGGRGKIGYFVTKILTLILLRTLIPEDEFLWNIVFPRLCNVREGGLCPSTNTPWPSLKEK